MKRTTDVPILLAALLAASLIAGCASNRPADDADDASGSDRYDRDYIAAVEQKARANGVKVYWTSPPRRSSRPEDDG